jgi:hypothetical protein
MPASAFGEFDRVAVRIVSAHRAFPGFFVRRLEELDSSAFQVFVKRVEVIGGQLDMDARPLLRRGAFRAVRIAAVVDQETDRSASRSADADHGELRRLVDFNPESELLPVKLDRPRHIRNA